MGFFDKIKGKLSLGPVEDESIILKKMDILFEEGTSEAEEFEKLGRKSEALNKYNETMNKLVDLAKVNPKNYIYMLKIAELMMKLGYTKDKMMKLEYTKDKIFFEAAEKIYLLIIDGSHDDRDADLTRAYWRLGFVEEYLRNNKDAALKYYELAINSPKGNKITKYQKKYDLSAAYLSLARLYKDQDVELSRQYANQRLEVVPDCPQAKEILASFNNGFNFQASAAQADKIIVNVEECDKEYILVGTKQTIHIGGAVFCALLCSAKQSGWKGGKDLFDASGNYLQLPDKTIVISKENAFNLGTILKMQMKNAIDDNKSPEMLIILEYLNFFMEGGFEVKRARKPLPTDEPVPAPTSSSPQPGTEPRENKAPHFPEEKTQLRHDLSPPHKASMQGKTHPHFQPGDTILSNYRVEDVITTGGMGVIYVTTHTGWKVKVAIKSPTEEMLSDREFATRITREADAWTNLGLHPHIAYCYFVRAIEEVPHLFVEYVDGGNLKDWIESGKCADLKIALDLAIQFCHGMAYAHGKGMIHRDIKPANILMTKEGILKITDFGIARWGKEDTSSRNSAFTDTTKTMGFIGTPHYASPEQLRDAHNVHEETDIFSFGVCLWEMLLGRRPYPIAIEKIPLSDPLSLRPDLPPEFASLLTDMVAFDLETRKNLKGFASLKNRFESIYQSLFSSPSPHYTLETLDLKADGLNNRGVSYLELEKEEEAVRCWEQALKEDPQHLEATFNYGYYRCQKGAPYHVLGTPMSSLKGIHEGKHEFWRLLAWLYYEQGEINALEELQNSAHRVTDPEFLKLYDDLNSPTGEWVRIWHSDSVLSVAFSPDGRYVLSGSEGKTISLWEVATGKELRRFEGHSGWVRSVAFSPDGRYVLSGSWDSTIRLWEAATGKEFRRFEGHSDWVFSVAFSPDGRYVLSGSGSVTGRGIEDNTFRLWEVATGKELRRFEGHSGWGVSSVAFSPDGRYVLSGSEDKTIRLWEAATGKEFRRFVGHNGYVSSVAFSPDGRYILSGSQDETISLWEVATGKEFRRFKGHSSWVTSVAFSPDGRYVLSGSEDKTIRLWDVATGKEIWRFEGHSDAVRSVAFSPDGRYFLSGSWDRTIRLCPWEFLKRAQDVGPYPVLSRIRPPSELLTESRAVQVLLASATACIGKGSFKEAYTLLRQIQLAPGYERNKDVLDLITLCGLKGLWRRRDFRAGWHVATVDGHNGSVHSVTFSPDGRYVLLGSDDNTLRLREVATGQEIKRFEGHKSSVCSVTFSPDGSFVLSDSQDETIRLWEVATGQELKRFEGHKSSVRFSPDGSYILSVGEDNTLRLWEVATGKELRRFEGHGSSVNSVAFSPDGRYVISGSGSFSCGFSDNYDQGLSVLELAGVKGLKRLESDDKTLRLWDAATGKELRRFEGHSDQVTSVAFSPDCRYILSGSADKTLRLWEIATGKELRRFEGHSNTVRSVAFSPDGRYVLSGSDDRTIRLWEAATGKELWRFEGHSGWVRSVAFSPDGRYILSGSADKTLRLWELDWEWEFPE